MPPKTSFTKDRVVQAAVQIAREQGWEQINARTVSQALGCSTQPVMYQFATIEELKRAAYDQVDQFHTQFLLTPVGDGADPMMEIGLNYIRFALREPNLFRFLFQSGYAREHSILEMLDSPELTPVLEAMEAGMGLGMDRTKEVFMTLAMFAHGYASILANHTFEHNEELLKRQLERVYTGAMLAAAQDND